MKINKRYLQKIIEEELNKLINEQYNVQYAPFDDGRVREYAPDPVAWQPDYGSPTDFDGSEEDGYGDSHLPGGVEPQGPGPLPGVTQDGGYAPVAPFPGGYKLSPDDWVQSLNQPKFKGVDPFNEQKKQR